MILQSYVCVQHKTKTLNVMLQCTQSQHGDMTVERHIENPGHAQNRNRTEMAGMCMEVAWRGLH